MILIGLLKRQNNLLRFTSPSILRSIDVSRFFSTNQEQFKNKSLLSVRLPVLVQQPYRTRKLKYSFGYTNYGHRRHVRPPGHHVVQYLQFFFIIIGAYAIFYLVNVTEFEDRWSQTANGNQLSEMNTYINPKETQRRLDVFSNVKAASVLPSSIDNQQDINENIDLSEVTI